MCTADKRCPAPKESQDEARSQELPMSCFPSRGFLLACVGIMEAGRSWPAGGNPRMARGRFGRGVRSKAIRGLPPTGHVRHVGSSLGAGHLLFACVLEGSEKCADNSGKTRAGRTARVVEK